MGLKRAFLWLSGFGMAPSMAPCSWPVLAWLSRCSSGLFQVGSAISTGCLGVPGLVYPSVPASGESMRACSDSDFGGEKDCVLGPDIAAKLLKTVLHTTR